MGLCDLRKVVEAERARGGRRGAHVLILERCAGVGANRKVMNVARKDVFRLGLVNLNELSEYGGLIVAERQVLERARHGGRANNGARTRLHARNRGAA